MMNKIEEKIFKGAQTVYRAMNKTDYEALEKTKKLISPANKLGIPGQEHTMTTRLKHVYLGPKAGAQWDSPYTSSSKTLYTAITYFDDMRNKEIDAVIAKFTLQRIDAYNYINPAIHQETLALGGTPVADVELVEQEKIDWEREQGKTQDDRNKSGMD